MDLSDSNKEYNLFKWLISKNNILNNGIQYLLERFIDNYNTITDYERSTQLINLCNDIINNKKKSIKSTIGIFIPEIYLLAY